MDEFWGLFLVIDNFMFKWVGNLLSLLIERGECLGRFSIDG